MTDIIFGTFRLNKYGLADHCLDNSTDHLGYYVNVRDEDIQKFIKNIVPDVEIKPRML